MKTAKELLGLTLTNETSAHPLIFMPGDQVKLDGLCAIVDKEIRRAEFNSGRSDAVSLSARKRLAPLGITAESFTPPVAVGATVSYGANVARYVVRFIDDDGSAMVKNITTGTRFVVKVSDLKVVTP